MQSFVRRFLSEVDVDTVVTQSAYQAFSKLAGGAKDLLLLRGLLVHGILFLCLQKRWNGQYGLNSKRNSVAVPFPLPHMPEVT